MSKNQSKINLSDMPLEVMLKIIAMLPAEDRDSIRTANKKLKHATNLHYFWINEIIDKPDDKLIKELELASDSDLDYLMSIVNEVHYRHSTYDQPADPITYQEVENEYNKYANISKLVQKEIERRQKGGKKTHKKGGNMLKMLPFDLMVKILLNLDQRDLLYNTNYKLLSKDVSDMHFKYFEYLNDLISKDDKDFESIIKDLKFTKQELENFKKYIDLTSPGIGSIETYADFGDDIYNSFDNKVNEYDNKINKETIIDNFIKNIK